MPVIFHTQNGKKYKLTKKQFRNFFLKQKLLKEAQKEVQIIEESLKTEKEGI